MEMDKRIETLESEFKLMRGELKQTLGGVRDYLLNLKLPPSQEAALLAEAMSGGGADLLMNGKFSMESPDDKGKPREAKPPEDKPPKEELTPVDEAEEEEEEEEESSEPKLPEEEPPMDQEPTLTEVSLTVPPVNLLANLIRWVANAKREIGSQQLPTFLEVYGISGHLSPELKDVILQLADVVASVESADTSTADIWSQMMLELHGILVGGDVPLRPLGPLWNNASSDVRRGQADKPKHRPSKLKLVLTGGDGKDKEFSLDLKPEEE